MATLWFSGGACKSRGDAKTKNRRKKKQNTPREERPKRFKNKNLRMLRRSHCRAYACAGTREDLYAHRATRKV